jgi:hypothetical protein
MTTRPRALPLVPMHIDETEPINVLIYKSMGAVKRAGLGGKWQGLAYEQLSKLDRDGQLRLLRSWTREPKT